MSWNTCNLRRICVALGLLLAAPEGAIASHVSLGPRPPYLVDGMEDGPLKEKLTACIGTPARHSDFSIGHRGAALQFPEHSAEGYRAAALMGAGIIECDVTFTKDKELVCRHSQNDLHQTTNILATDLAGTCKVPFSPAEGEQTARAECLTSDITREEFLSLKAKMDGADKTATSVEDYIAGTPGWQTDLYASGGTVVTHAQSIDLIRSLDAKFMPELKAPKVAMPFDGFSREDYAQKLIDEYKAAGIPPENVWPQSFDLQDIRYWIENEPEFGAQAVYLDGRFGRDGVDSQDPSTFSPSMKELKAMGVNYIAPPIWMLLTLSPEGRILPSAYAVEARGAGLKMIAWTLERSGPLNSGGGWYYQSIADAIDGDGRLYEVLNVLAQDVGVSGIFSDWPATVTFYANCMGLD
ncbi:glycerophosphodiester phosphodiesterase family protein [Roseibium sp.]|uniref:glycerophosphodiester phosphodiesterase family protein n=1 Tax=Roseibium sp. TaxID=1936156 RepID=UPI003A984C39